MNNILSHFGTYNYKNVDSLLINLIKVNLLEIVKIALSNKTFQI